MAGTIAAERPLALARFNRATPRTTPGHPPSRRTTQSGVCSNGRRTRQWDNTDNGTDLSDVSDRRFQQMARPSCQDHLARPAEARIKGQTSCGEVPFQRLEFDSQGRTDKGTDLFAVRGWRRFCGCLIRNEDGRRATDKETDHFGSGTVSPRSFTKVRQACSGGLKCRKSTEGRMARPLRWARPSRQIQSYKRPDLSRRGALPKVGV